MNTFFMIFIGLPALEIFLMIKIGGKIGALNTISLILLTAIVGLFFLYLVPLPLYLIIPVAVGFGVGLMILLNVTHPPAGGNPIIVIMGSVSIDYILNPIITGSIIILIFGIIINRFILKKKYPKFK